MRAYSSLTIRGPAPAPPPHTPCFRTVFGFTTHDCLWSPACLRDTSQKPRASISYVCPFQGFCLCHIFFPTVHLATSLWFSARSFIYLSPVSPTASMSTGSQVPLRAAGFVNVEWSVCTEIMHLSDSLTRYSVSKKTSDWLVPASASHAVSTPVGASSQRLLPSTRIQTLDLYV